MLVLAASVLAALSAALFGGRLSRLFDVRLRGRWLPLTALVLQVVILQFAQDGPRPVLVCVHLATYAMAAAFIWVNRQVPGLLVVALGAASNAVTIALNHGTLPASTAAMAAAHIHKSAGAFLNSGPVAHPVLGYLGDVFAWPAPMPLANVFSVGDVLIVLGAGYGAHRITGARLPRGRRQEATGPPSCSAHGQDDRHSRDDATGRPGQDWVSGTTSR
jgi:hypothetical protein